MEKAIKLFKRLLVKTLKDVECEIKRHDLYLWNQDSSFKEDIFLANIHKKSVYSYFLSKCTRDVDLLELFKEFDCLHNIKPAYLTPDVFKWIDERVLVSVYFMLYDALIKTDVINKDNTIKQS